MPDIDRMFRNRIIGYGEKPASQFQANPQNWRKHPQRQRDAVHGSLNELGWVDTVLENVTTGNLIDGHERIWQALSKGDDEPVPFLQVELTEDEERLALAILDPLTNMANTDAELLDSLLRDVQTSDEHLMDMLSELAEESGLYFGEQPDPVEDVEPQIDRAEELREKWGVELGQLWQLGEHRLICGDCTDAAVVERVMGGEKADTLVSDPPYGIGYKYAEYDDTDNAQNLELVQKAWHLGPAPKVWTCGLSNLSRDLRWNAKAKVLCWWRKFARARNGLGGASTWEPILVVGVSGGTLPNDHIEMMTDRVEGLLDLHTCPKPIGLFTHLIRHLAGNIVYDPFLGSGTTLIACEQLGRQCRAVEISPGYVAVAIQRWADATGGTPRVG